MRLTIQFKPQINDLVLISLLVDQLTELALKSDPATAKSIRREIGYRLKRLKTVTASD